MLQGVAVTSYQNTSAEKHCNDEPSAPVVPEMWLHKRMHLTYTNCVGDTKAWPNRYTAAAVITQTIQFVEQKCCNCDPHTAVRWELPTGDSGCDTGATSRSARRSDKGLEPDAAVGRVLMNDVMYVASGRRQVLLVMELWFDTRLSNADAVGVCCLPVSGPWLLL